MLIPTSSLHVLATAATTELIQLTADHAKFLLVAPPRKLAVLLVPGLTTRSFQLFHCRPHDAQEVYVTGTFDNWSKSERLEKVDGVWQKTVTLPERAEKFYYKVGATSLLLS